LNGSKASGVESYVKNVGEYVEADEVIARIETDKVTVDILSQDSGVITKVFAEEGDTVEVGAEFVEIDTDAKAPAGGAAPKEAPTQAAPEKTASTPPPEAPKKDTPAKFFEYFPEEKLNKI
jgi:2-oxoglutarate dehydrogenase E2 component (dihydrolipoamide succinyltransferase)